MRTIRGLLLILLLVPRMAGAAVPADVDAVAAELMRRPVVIFGEVHDNRFQHDLRVRALRRLLASGARPALAFEQIDREGQWAIERARDAVAGQAGPQAADQVIAQAGGRDWDWSLYRPYIELALQHGLPIIAANLSRSDASRVIRDGYSAVFDAEQLARLRLDSVPAPLLAAQAEAVDKGHCNMLSPQQAERFAHAQVARDAAMAEAIRPHLPRGVVLLTGNGHARRDIGVTHFLNAEERARTWTIGLIEQAALDGSVDQPFDAWFVTPTQSRDDPCAQLRRPR